MDRSFEYLNRALDEHGLTNVFVMYSPLLAKSRENPRHHDPVAKIRNRSGLAN
jgi:hypothetical protein